MVEVIKIVLAQSLHKGKMLFCLFRVRVLLASGGEYPGEDTTKSWNCLLQLPHHPHTHAVLGTMQ
jgi:hypothetical protein